MDIRHFWRSRTTLEKVLVCSVAFLCFVVVVLFVSFLVNNDTGVCHSPQCVRNAIHLLDTIDPSVDPCDDFHKFSCGTLIKNSFIKKQPSSLHSLQEVTKNQLKLIVMETRNESSLPKTLIQQKKFYKMCLNTTAIENENNAPLLKVLDEILGGWPIINSYSWNDRDFEWPKAVIKARQAGVFYEFFFLMTPYPETFNNKVVLWIKPPLAENVEKLELQDKNIDFIAQIAKYLGAQSVGMTTELRRTMQFAEQLKKIIIKHYNRTIDEDEYENATTNMTIRDIHIPHFKFDWLSYLKEISGVNLTGEDEVFITTKEYFEDFHNLIVRTPKKILADYMGWSIISHSINYSTEDVRNKYMEIKQVDEVDKGKIDRKELCYKIAIECFKDVAEGEYVRRYTSKEKKDYIGDMIRRLKKELRDSLQATPWFDEESRRNELKHLENITEYIGWTSAVFNVSKFDEIFNYKNLKFPSDNFFDMARIVNKAGVDRSYLSIPNNRSFIDWLLYSPIVDVNAFFVHSKNILILPAPILQGNIFNEENPRYVNYGALGTVIGHELSHGFDGTLGLESYWTNQTRDKFLEVTQCLKDEYAHFDEHLEGFNSNGSFAENLADFNALHISYRAYQNWVATYGQEKSLPGIKYTPNQIFWLMASTYMCFDPISAVRDKFNKGHGVPSFRVVGRLKNSEEFAKDFNCPEGSRMNPKKKCKIYP